MKNRIATGIILGLSGLLFVIGPLYIFKACSTKEMVMNCHWSVQAEAGVGILLFFSGGLYLLADSFITRLFLLLQTTVIYIISILIPTILIGGCKNKDMACQSLTFPAIYLIAALSLIYITGTLVYLLSKIKQSS